MPAVSSTANGTETETTTSSATTGSSSTTGSTTVVSTTVGSTTNGGSTGSDGGTTGGEDAWPPGDWTQRRRLTFDGASLEAGLVDFPVLVRLDENRIDYGGTLANGADLAFFSGDAGMQLPHEIEQWNPNGESIVWVRTPAISDTPDGDHIWMLYGAPSPITPLDPTAVWSEGFVGVWHCDNPGGGVTTDAAGGHDGTFNSTVDLASSPIFGPGLRTFGTNYVEIDDVPTLDLATALTLEGWAQPEQIDGGNRQSIIRKRDVFRLDASQESAAPSAMQINDGAGGATTPGPTLTPNERVFLAGTYDSASGNLVLYIDGFEVNTTSLGAMPPIQTSNMELRIGEHINGDFDEIRIADVARTPGWIAATHRSGTDVMLTYGAEETRL